MKNTVYGFILLLLFFSNTFAQPGNDRIIVFKGDNIVIGEYVSILEDTSNKMGIQEAISAKNYENSGANAGSIW